MSFPGFTAEASLYKTSENYKMDGTIGAPASGEKMMVQPSQDSSNCHCWWDSPFCAGHVWYVPCTCWINGFPSFYNYPIGSC